MAHGRKNISKKGSDKRGRFAASKGRSYSQRHRVAGWEASSLEAVEVDSWDEETIKYIASKVYNEIRKLKSKPGKTFADFEAICYSLYWIADANHLILFRDSKGRNVGVLAYDVVTPWYTKHTCFEELFVLGLDPAFHGFGRVAAKWMEETAKLNHIPLLETAAALPEDPQLAKNLYMKKQGFTLEYPSFVKILKEGKR